MAGHAPARQSGRVGQLEGRLRQSGLADAGRPGEEDAAGLLVLQPVGQAVELSASTDDGPPGRKGWLIRGAERIPVRLVGRAVAAAELRNPDIGDESVTAAVQGLDDALLLAVVADRPAGRLDPGGEG